MTASPTESISSPEDTLPTEPFFSWEESKYSLDNHSDSHSGSIDISINAIYLVPALISTSAPTDIFISTDDNSIDSSDPVNSSDSFVTENPDTYFDRDNLLAKDFGIDRITSKSLDTTTASITEELHNAYTIREKLDTGAKVSCTNIEYILHNYKPYTSKFLLPLQLKATLDTSKSNLPKGEGYIRVSSTTTQGYIDIKKHYPPCLTSTLISENSILTASKSNTKYPLSQNIKNNISKEISNGSTTIMCNQQKNRAKDLVIHGIINGNQFYSNLIIVPDVHISDLHANIHNSMQFALLHDSSFAQLCNNLFW